LGVDRLGGLTEDPLAMSCQTVEPGLRRKPSPREERGARGTRGVPLLRKHPKRDARAAPPRRSGRRADPSFPRQGADSSHLAPGRSRPKRGDRLLHSTGTGPCGHPVGAPPPPTKTTLLTSKVRGLGGEDRQEVSSLHSGKDSPRVGRDTRSPP
jgi:hypothetical protein